MKILVVEDDVDSRIFLDRALRSDGYVVETATNGLQALEKAAHSPPDMIISDIMMPGMDGFELCRKVKEDERLKDIPFLFYSATYIDRKDENLAMSLGASRFLVKPIEPDAFMKIVREVIKECRAGDIPQPDEPVLDIEKIDRLQVEVYARKLEKKVGELNKERAAIRKTDEELGFQNIILSTQQEVSIDGILVVDENNTIISCNRRFVEMWGIPAGLIETKDDAKVLQYASTKLVDPEGFKAKARYLYDNRQETSRDEIDLSDGRSFDRYSSPMFGSDGKYYGRVWFFRDITEQKRSGKALESLRKQNLQILESVGEGILGLDMEGKHTFVNPSASRMFGYEPEELIGKFAHAIWHHSRIDGKKYPERECPIHATLKDEHVHNNIENEVFWRKDGSFFSVAYSSNPIMEEGRIVGAVVNFRDITHQKQMEEKLQYLAYYDFVTDLPNRTLFLDRIDVAIKRAKSASTKAVILIINIDRFKHLNDAYGTEIGDGILKEIARRLVIAVREGDTVARLSNDEFGIVLLDVQDPENIVPVLKKVIGDISRPMKISDEEMNLTFSTGISLYPDNGGNPTELLQEAGLALSMAKKEGGKTYQFYNEDMNTRAAERMLLEKQLIKAIKNKEFILYYQPYWDINLRKMVGMEALIRWKSPDGKLVPPGQFIPVLEDTRMIIEVGEWILWEATRQVREWQGRGYRVVPVSVNMSLVQFRQKNLMEIVRKIMSDCAFDPSLLTLEITESAFMRDVEFTRSVLTSMKEIGCSISIDDFGTGYSSLAYLKKYPIDNLKIDISFIREMVQDPDSASIVMAVINMAHTLNLKTIAEGIETEEQLNFLRLLRCDMGQGFYLSKPVPAEEIDSLYNSR